MAHENLVFGIIVTIVVIVFLLIFLRIWEIIKPYIILARKIIKVIDIIKNFSVEVALTLLNLIKDVIVGIFKIFDFDDVVVMALNSVVTKIDEVLNEKTLTELIAKGKRVVITAVGQTADNAVRFANQLVEKLVPVSLVLFDSAIMPSNKIDDKIHIININSQDLNISARGSSDMSILNVSRAKNSKSEYSIIKPNSQDINGYIEAVRNGFI